MIKSKIVQRAAVATAALSMGATALAIAPTAQAQTPTGTTTSASACAGIYYVTGNGVNFRRGASTAYRSIGLLYRNDEGRRIASHGSWVKLSLIRKSRSGLPAGTTGWVSKAYVQECTPTQLD
jgi:hypothetical protein